MRLSTPRFLFLGRRPSMSPHLLRGVAGSQPCRQPWLRRGAVVAATWCAAWPVHAAAPSAGLSLADWGQLLAVLVLVAAVLAGALAWWLRQTLSSQMADLSAQQAAQSMAVLSGALTQQGRESQMQLERQIDRLATGLRADWTLATERLERQQAHFRQELAQQQQALREEWLQQLQHGRTQAATLAQDTQAQLAAQFAELRQQWQGHLQQAQEQAVLQRQSSEQSFHLLAQGLAERVAQLGEAQERQHQQMRETLTLRLQEVQKQVELRLGQLQASNEARLEQMRATVDEKLQATLEQRLGESFKQVAERLEQVHRGLGEMQTLAQGVGDLRRVLGNVKSRGILGEVQLQALLEQVLTAEQYGVNVAVVPGSRERVEFAVKLPGRQADDPQAVVWLPIDAKFPREDYERLLDAQDRADRDAAEQAARALEQRLRDEAQQIAAKYIAPPHTTDFAILFLPTEGLFAEALRRPGLMERLQRDHHVTLAGPTTLLALLSSLQMGFRTLAIERRSAEVWKVLGAVKTEFGKFGDVLAKVRDHTQTVLNTLDRAEVRTRQMGRALKQVQALSEHEAQALPGWAEDSGDEAS